MNSSRTLLTKTTNAHAQKLKHPPTHTHALSHTHTYTFTYTSIDTHIHKHTYTHLRTQAIRDITNFELFLAVKVVSENRFHFVSHNCRILIIQFEKPIFWI